MSGNFWNQVASQGAPLIEPIPGHPDKALVTFVWRADPSHTSHVALVGGVGNIGTADNLLSHIPGTDIWHRSYVAPADARAVYAFVPNAPLFSLEDLRLETFQATFESVAEVWQADPFNGLNVWYGSGLELPDAPPQPYIQELPNVPVGDLLAERMRSLHLGNERDLFIYTPAEYDPACFYPLLLLFDGQAYCHHVPTATILDNLIHQGKIPPTVAVLIGNATEVSRNLELPCHTPMVDFLAEELLPWVHAHYSVAKDPEQVIIGGSSFGGLASCHAAYRRPDLFGNVLAQSAALWWGVDQPEWLVRQYEKVSHLPVKFYLDAGTLENEPSLGGTADYVDVNRRFASLLRSKGCAVTHSEFSGMHCYLCWQGTLSDGLIALFADLES